MSEQTLDAYVDESGDTGYQFHANSSLYFVLGMIIPENPEALIDQILAARRKLGKPASYEFHFHQADLRCRDIFFEAIAQEPIKIYSAVVHKSFALPDFQRSGKLGLYSHAIAGLVLRSPIPLSKYKLYLDGHGKQKQFLQTLHANVRSICRSAKQPERSFREIRLLDSAHSLIQCTDMITGAVAIYVNKAETRWFDRIKSGITVLWHERFK